MVLIGIDPDCITKTMTDELLTLYDRSINKTNKQQITPDHKEYYARKIKHPCGLPHLLDDPVECIGQEYSKCTLQQC